VLPEINRNEKSFVSEDIRKLFIANRKRSNLSEDSSCTRNSATANLQIENEQCEL